VEVTATDSLLEIEDLVKDLEVQLRKKMEELYALKGELNNIASTERQARAALAEATLRGTAQGRELLEAMTQMAGLMEVPQIGMTLNDEVK
jgi:sortase (surface protein transpeptidase)